MTGINPFERKFTVLPEELKDADKPGELAELIGKIENANDNVADLNKREKDIQAFIRPESESDKAAARENYQLSLKSLEIELSALDATSEQIFSNPDEIQISIYGAKIKDAEEQIESLDSMCRNKGNSDLDATLDVYKKRFSEHKMVDMEKLKQRLG